MSGRRSWAEGRWWRGARTDLLVVFAFVVVLIFGLHAYTLRQMTTAPLQRYYLASYRAGCSVAPTQLVLPYVRRANGTRTLASLDDVVALPPTQTAAVRFRLSESAVHSRSTRLDFMRVSVAQLPAACEALNQQIQANRASFRPSIPPHVAVPIGTVTVALVLGLYRHRKAGVAMRRGQVLRGPELVTARTFNRLVKGDGASISVTDAPVGGSRFGSRRSTQLRLRAKDESSHFLLMGDTGTGKSSLIRQLLQQVDDRGQAAVVYDPALEFTPQFYRPKRGDRILNPLDLRMPYWNPGDEIQHKAEALAFAKALFPDDKRDNRFFVESPRKIFARLLSFRPTAQEIASWLQRPEEVDRLLAGTELASMIDPHAASQRAGVLASLSMVGDAFQLLPQQSDTTCSWSAYEWSQHRKGWLFLTSTPQTLDRLRPLITLWIDLVLMRLLSGGDPVWLFLDELPTLNKLPKLPESLAIARKPNVRLVLGLQGRAQLEARYGTESEAMLSQPATKVFLRTSEPKAAEWISKALGEVEVERLRESVNYDKFVPLIYQRKSHNYSLDRQTKPLVLPSEIMGLTNLTAYLKSENYSVRFRFEPNPPHQRRPPLQLRPANPHDWPTRPAPIDEPQPETVAAAAPRREAATTRKAAAEEVSSGVRKAPAIDRTYFE